MSPPIRLCFWTTTFQADVLTLVRRLTDDPRFEILVALDDRDGFLKEPVQTLVPVTCRLIDKEDRHLWREIEAFAPDVVVVDNHFPPRRIAPRLFVLWHGFGWKGPNDMVEFAEVHKSISRLTGAPGTTPNANFRWQCFGPTDLEHRHLVSGFARENLLNLGAAFTDDLLHPPFDPRLARRALPTDWQERKLVLFAPTWHYGRVFSHWGDDIGLIGELCDFVTSQDGRTILRLHDRKRFEPDYLKALERLAASRDDLLLKYKDRNRDSLLDLLAADVVVSNFSSILNYAYATGKPSVHIYPVASADEAFLWRTLKNGKIRVAKVKNAHYVWKLDPEQNGGLMVHSFGELLAALRQGFADPRCCEARARQFIERHMAPVDGNTCARIAAALVGLHERADR